MKIAILGVGYWGSKLLRSLVGLVGADHVVAIDSDPSRLAWVSRHYPEVQRLARLDEALSDPRVHAVVVATPVVTHAGFASAILAAGRHVLVEKPLTTAAAEAVRLAEDAERRGLVLMVGHTFLFSPRVQWIYDRLHGKGIGKVRYLMSSRLNLGKHCSDVSVIWDLAPHDLSIALWLLGEVPAVVHTSAQSIAREGNPDVAFINLSFPSGIVAAIAVSWLAPRKVRSLVLVGDDNMVVYDDIDPDEPVRVYDKGIEWDAPPDFGSHQLTYRYGDTVAPHIPVREPITEQLEHFIDCIATHQRPVSDGWFGARVVAALEAADTSWRNHGRPTPVAWAPGRFTP